MKKYDPRKRLALYDFQDWLNSVPAHKLPVRLRKDLAQLKKSVEQAIYSLGDLHISEETRYNYNCRAAVIKAALDKTENEQ